MTTGIAIVGASVIAVAPVVVPPPEVPAVEVAVVNSVRSMTTDVELTASWVDLLAAVPEAAALILQVALQPVPLPANLEALAIALVKAGGPAITETVKLFTETLPAEAQNLIATGQYAHLAVLAANAVYLGTLTPIAPFAVAVMEALPLPIGQKGGLIDELLVLGVQTPFQAGVTILSLAADVIDNGLSPADALSGSIGAVYTAVTASIASVSKIVAAFGAAVPFGAAQPKVMEQARTATPDLPAANDINIGALSQDSSSQQSVIMTVESDDVDSSTVPETADESTAGDPSDDDSQDSAGEDVTTNGATDLSDGNMAEPAVAGGEAADDSAEDSTIEARSVDEQTMTTDSTTGSNEGSGADSESSGE